jgi:hypothetical protein
LAELSVAKADAPLMLDWSEQLRHGAWYKAMYRPAALRANRLTPNAVYIARVQGPLPAAHVCEPLHRGRNTVAGDQPVHEPRQGHNATIALGV